MGKPTRAVLRAMNGAVASPHYLGSLAGLQVLQAGGTAVDAVIAVNATLGVVYPHMTGIGGDAFWLIHDAKTGKVEALNGSGCSVAGATRDEYRSRKIDVIPFRGPMAAISLPCAVASWCAAHERYGKLPMTDLLAPAIRYAKNGFPVCDSLHTFITDHAKMLSEYPTTARHFMPDGAPPAAGSVLKMPQLGDTLQAIANEGHAGFYSGGVADEMAAAIAAAGGLWQPSDLGTVQADWDDPISTTYRGRTILQHPPNTQGFVHLMLLNVLEHFDLAAMGDRSAEYIHVNTEACRLIFQDRDRYLSDPKFCEIPLDKLLSKEYAAELADRIRRKEPEKREPQPVGGDTVATVVVDGEGNAVTLIQSIYHEFGSGFVAGETGVLLQNRGSMFSLDDSHVNTLEPGKRSFHTLVPGMMMNNGAFELAYGTMGGEGQPQTSTMLVTRYLDFGMDMQQCVDAPRWLFGRTWGEDLQNLRVEESFGSEVIEDLRKRGHQAEPIEDKSDILGHAMIARRDNETGVVSAGADPRSEGIAVGW